MEMVGYRELYSGWKELGGTLDSNLCECVGEVGI